MNRVTANRLRRPTTLKCDPETTAAQLTSNLLASSVVTPSAHAHKMRAESRKEPYWESMRRGPVVDL